MLMLSYGIYDIELLKELSILYVDDDEFARDSIQDILSNKIKSIYTAKNGQDGLAIYKQHDIDIVMTDIQMPIMSGIEMVKEIKNINSNAKIIYVSAHNEEDTLMKAIEAGADGFIIKPIRIQTKLLFTLNKVAKDINKDKIIKKYNETIQLILDCIDSLIIVSNGNQIIHSNDAFLEFVGCDDLSQFHKQHKSISELFVNEDGLLQSQYDNSDWLKVAIQTQNSKVKMKDTDNNERVFLVKPTPVTIDNNNYVIDFADITDIENEKEKLHNQASHDILTRIFNRHSFEMFFDKQLVHFSRTKEIFCILFFDIDNFKGVNDKYGHQQGDNVLQDIAKLISSKIRHTDIFARWGGEEFIIILQNTTINNAKILSEKLRELIQHHTFSINQQVTCSFGLIEINKHTTKEHIIANADKALYKAKANGKNRVEIQTL